MKKLLMFLIFIFVLSGCLQKGKEYNILWGSRVTSQKEDIDELVKAQGTSAYKVVADQVHADTIDIGFKGELIEKDGKACKILIHTNNGDFLRWIACNNLQ